MVQLQATFGHILQRLGWFFSGPLTGAHTRYYWIFLAQAAVLVMIVHFAGGGRPGALPARFPVKALLHRSSLVDWQVNIANAVIGPALKLFWRISTPAAVAAVLVHAAVAQFGPPEHKLAATTSVLAGLTVLAVLGDDLGYYLFHRVTHAVPWLWSFHKLHHSAEVLTPLVAGRVHPLEEMLSEPARAVVSAAFMSPLLYWMQGDASVLMVGGISVAALLFGALGNQLLHAEIPISFGHRINRVLVSPAVHQIHHSALAQHHNRNFGGLLSVWDWWFGTLHLPRVGEPIEYGLEQGAGQLHGSLAAAYLRPFAEIADSIRAALGRGIGLPASDEPSSR